MSAEREFDHLLLWCREAPLDAGASAVEDHYWGFCAENGALAARWFAWFPARAEMLRYFADCWPFDYHAEAKALRSDPTVVLKAARFGVAVRRYEAEEIEEDLFLALMSEAHPNVTVHWLGTLEELLYGDASFACEWRAEFRALDIVEGGTPIEEDELDEALRSLAWE